MLQTWEWLRPKLVSALDKVILRLTLWRNRIAAVQSVDRYARPYRR